MERLHNILLPFAKTLGRHKVIYTFLALVVAVLTQGIALLVASLLAIPTAIYYLIFLVKTSNYYKTEEFLNIKQRLSKQIDEYNEFDMFMAESRRYIQDRQSQLTRGNFRQSTLTVYKNSQLDIYKYIVKYFFIDKRVSEESLQIIEGILQKYNTLDKTYAILSDEYNELMGEIKKTMYAGAYVFKKLTMKKLGSRKLPKFVKDFYIWYSFAYDSPANRKHYQNSVVLDEAKLQEFAEYLNALIRYRKSAKYQRQLMTPELREVILNRDHYKCKKCGVSKANEAHLLLEVDHIIPISKGGITIDSNLQALCWRCNREKGSKLAASAVI